ncbi:MAG TPA: hypothetical protein VHC47_07475, partial [Mucilaginibacter sp.]|nr:hypothetical protein [Mucilaginibacter sp.]
MSYKYLCNGLPATLMLCFLFAVSSCKKDSNNSGGSNVTPQATPKKIGLYEADSSIYKELDIVISKIGTQSVQFGLVFDTGSGGMVIDAHGVVPASMLTSSGFNFTGDSTVVDGITITNKTNIVEYGDDANTIDKVYGNLAYASVTVGDQSGNIVVKRLPFFLYYKAVDSKGNSFDPHEFDVFGVSPQYDITFSGGAYITSPFSYYTPGTGLTSGFKMAALGPSNFSLNGTLVPDVITLGLTTSDLSSSDFTMNQLSYYPGNGYVPYLPASITYNGKTVSGTVIYDTGTEPYNYLEDNTAAKTITQLPENSSVSITTTSGFNYGYTTSATDYLTYVENPSSSG